VYCLRHSLSRPDGNVLTCGSHFSVGLFVNSVTKKSWIDFNNRRRDSPVAGGGSTLGAGGRPQIVVGPKFSRTFDILWSIDSQKK